MRRLFTSVLFTLLLAAGTAMAFSASDNNDKKDKKDKGQKPILIIVYVPAWNPIIREASLPNIVTSNEMNVEDTTGAL